jgi:hypothetical protein
MVFGNKAVQETLALGSYQYRHRSEDMVAN